MPLEKIQVEEQYAEYEGNVYKRTKIGSKPWSDWEKTSDTRIPFYVKRFDSFPWEDYAA